MNVSERTPATASSLIISTPNIRAIVGEEKKLMTNAVKIIPVMVSNTRIIIVYILYYKDNTFISNYQTFFKKMQKIIIII